MLLKYTVNDILLFIPRHCFLHEVCRVRKGLLVARLYAVLLCVSASIA